MEGLLQQLGLDSDLDGEILFAVLEREAAAAEQQLDQPPQPEQQQQPADVFMTADPTLIPPAQGVQQVHVQLNEQQQLAAELLASAPTTQPPQHMLSTPQQEHVDFNALDLQMQAVAAAELPPAPTAPPIDATAAPSPAALAAASSRSSQRASSVSKPNASEAAHATAPRPSSAQGPGGGVGKRRIQPIIISKPRSNSVSVAKTPSAAVKPAAGAAAPGAVANKHPHQLTPAATPRTPASVPAEHVERHYDNAEDVRMSGDEDDGEEGPKATTVRGKPAVATTQASTADGEHG